MLINIRVAADTRTPIALVQLPLGLNLPAGAKLQVDDGKTADLQIQTCEQRGCYANTPIAAVIGVPTLRLSGHYFSMSAAIGVLA